VTLLGSLPSSYSTLVTALEARDAITLSYAQQALIREEQRLKGESKAGGSAASTGRALLGKQTESQKASPEEGMFLVWRNWSFLQRMSKKSADVQAQAQSQACNYSV